MLIVLIYILAIASAIALFDYLVVAADPELARLRAAKHSMLAHRLLPDWALYLLGAE